MPFREVVGRRRGEQQPRWRAAAGHLGVLLLSALRIPTFFKKNVFPRSVFQKKKFVFREYVFYVIRVINRFILNVICNLRSAAEPLGSGERGAGQVARGLRARCPDAGRCDPTLGKAPSQYFVEFA